MLLYGYPQDWIRALGKSIVKVHLKDFKRKESGYEWVNLGDGEVDWEAVREPFVKLPTRGALSLSLKAGTRSTSGT